MSEQGTDYARSLESVENTHTQTQVHNHPPYRPICNERTVDGQLRGACLNDDGSDQ